MKICKNKVYDHGWLGRTTGRKCNLLDTDANLAIDVQFKDNANMSVILMRVWHSSWRVVSDWLAYGYCHEQSQYWPWGDEAAKIARIAQNLCEEGLVVTWKLVILVTKYVSWCPRRFCTFRCRSGFTCTFADIDREYQSATRTLMTYMTRVILLA